MIANFPKQPRDNEKRLRQVRFNEKGNCACDNDENNNDHKVYASMARISSNDEHKSENYGDSSQLTNWILDSVETCHMIPEVLDFIPGSLEDTDNTLKLRKDITSLRNKKDKYK